MLTNTMIAIIKVIFISVGSTIVMFGLSDMNYISSFYYSIRNIISGVPGVQASEGFLASIFSYISVIISDIYDKIGRYGLPSTPLPDTYHM